VIAKPRITVGAPEVTMTRSLLHRAATPARDARPAGRVTGLAEVLPALDVDHPAPPEPAPRPVRAVPRPAQHLPLTAATPEYVGQPRAAAEPHRAPAWLRALSSGQVMDPLLGAVMPASQPRPSAAPRPPARRTSPADGTPPRRPLRPRGRLGLGAPLQPGPADPDPDAEPAPPRATAAPAGIPALPPGPPPGGRSQAGPSQAGLPEAQLPHAGPPRTVPAPTAASPPPALAREVGAASGVDLDGVLVHRGPDVDRRAEQLGAAAFAVDDAVHLGSAAGPDDGAAARALLAHELTHIAQQRKLGQAIPDEASPAGADLEAEAIAVEQAVRDSRPLPRLTHPRPAVQPEPLSPREPGPDGAASGTGVSSRESARAVQAARYVTAAPPPPARSHPASPAPVLRNVVRGRVQRRPLDLDHARSSPPAAVPAPPSPPQAAPTPAAAPAAAAQPPASAPATTTPAATPAAATGSTRPSWSGFGQALANDLGDMVLASWSLEEVRDTGRGGGTNQGGNSREERFNALAGPALERLNEQRRDAGQPELAALPFDEEQRIWAQVDAGGGGGGTGTGQHGNRPAPIRNWHDFGAAVESDLLDEIGSHFGIDGAELMGRDSSTADAQPAAAATQPAGASHPATPSRPGAAAQPGAAAHHDDHHHDDKKIETDDLDLDELGTRLYDRIRSRLRLELLLDRERAGLLSDFR
jgi:hypothetical protein